MSKTKRSAAIVLSAAACWFNSANAEMSSLWHWETVTINPGESWHHHFDGVPIGTIDTTVWIDWLTVGTAHIQLDMHGQFHLDSGDSVHVDVQSSGPFVDWEMFTNVGDEPASMHGGYQSSGGQGDNLWIGPVLPGEMGSTHIEVNNPDPASGGYSLQKWLTNDSPLTQWWDYSSTTTAWVMFDMLETFHLDLTSIDISTVSSWLWINNDGDNPITFVVHYHVPTPGGVILLAVAAPFAARRKRR